MTDKVFLFSEGDVLGGSVETLIFVNYFDFSVVPNTSARVGNAGINATIVLLME